MLLRAILAIPALVCLYFARWVAWVVLVTGWFGALFTGRLPDYAASYLTGFQRWEVRAYAYLLLLTDRYPPFGVAGCRHGNWPAVRPGFRRSARRRLNCAMWTASPCGPVRATSRAPGISLRPPGS